MLLSDWDQYLEDTVWWPNLPSVWIASAMKHGIDMFLLFYDDLLNNLERTVVKLAYFLGVNLSPEDLKCILDNKEGHFHRSSKNKEMVNKIAVNATRYLPSAKKLKGRIRECIQMKKCMLSGCGFLHI